MSCLFLWCLWVVHRRTHFKTHWLSVADKSKYSLMLWIRNSRIAIFCPKNVKIYRRRRRRRLTDGGNLTSGDFLFESEKKWFMSFQLKPKWKIPLFSSTRTRRTGFAIFLSWLANARQSVSQSVSRKKYWKTLFYVLSGLVLLLYTGSTGWRVWRKLLNEQIIEDKGSCRLAAILLAQSASRQIEIFSIIHSHLASATVATTCNMCEQGLNLIWPWLAKKIKASIQWAIPDISFLFIFNFSYTYSVYKTLQWLDLNCVLWYWKRLLYQLSNIYYPSKLRFLSKHASEKIV